MGRGDNDSVEVEVAQRIPEHLKSEQPIQRMLTMNNTLEPISQLTRRLRDNDLSVDQSYQRGMVWGEKRKQNFIKSAVMGLPLGSIFINRRSWDFGGEYIVDGQQRLHAFKDFEDDKFVVFGGWFKEGSLQRKEDARGLITYSQLSESGQRMVDNVAMLSVYRTNFETDCAAQEKQLFDLINFGGLAQGQSD